MFCVYKMGWDYGVMVETVPGKVYEKFIAARFTCHTLTKETLAGDDADLRAQAEAFGQDVNDRKKAHLERLLSIAKGGESLEAGQ